MNGGGREGHHVFAVALAVHLSLCVAFLSQSRVSCFKIVAIPVGG